MRIYPALPFFNRCKLYSPKVLGLESIIASLKDYRSDKDNPKVSVVEFGMQRSLGKFTLFSDGWSTLTFASDRDVVLLSVDPEMAKQKSTWLRDVIRVLREDSECGVDTCSLGMAEFAALELDPNAPNLDLFYFDGPDDPKVTNDTLGYVVPYIKEKGRPAVILFDDAGVKYFTSPFSSTSLMDQGFTLRSVLHRFELLTSGHPVPVELFIHQFIAVYRADSMPGLISDWERNLKKVTSFAPITVGEYIP